jgi:hypothetical protein
VKYQSKNESIEARQFTAGTSAACAALAGIPNLIGHVEGDCMVINTERGAEIARVGDYIVRHPCGDVRVMSRELFESLFQPVASWSAAAGEWRARS